MFLLFFMSARTFRCVSSLNIYVYFPLDQITLTRITLASLSNDIVATQSCLSANQHKSDSSQQSLVSRGSRTRREQKQGSRWRPLTRAQSVFVVCFCRSRCCWETGVGSNRQTQCSYSIARMRGAAEALCYRMFAVRPQTYERRHLIS